MELSIQEHCPSTACPQVGIGAYSTGAGSSLALRPGPGSGDGEGAAGVTLCGGSTRALVVMGGGRAVVEGATLTAPPEAEAVVQANGAGSQLVVRDSRLGPAAPVRGLTVGGASGGRDGGDARRGMLSLKLLDGVKEALHVKAQRGGPQALRERASIRNRCCVSMSRSTS